MLVRDDGGVVTVIGQASHAWLSGQLARAWGNADFDPPDPYEEVCLAAEQHDVGMARWDLAPPLAPGTGRPQSFTEMALADHLALWRAAPSRLLSQSRYAALLVSMHGTALYERRDLARLSESDADAVRDFLASERDWQRHQRERVGADAAVHLRRNQRLLWTWDGLSLAICLGWSPYVAEGVPTRGDAVGAVRLSSRSEAVFTVDPWPFSPPRVQLRCESRRLDERHASADSLHAALADAPSEILSFTLVTAAG